MTKLLKQTLIQYVKCDVMYVIMAAKTSKVIIQKHPYDIKR